MAFKLSLGKISSKVTYNKEKISSEDIQAENKLFKYGM